MPPKTCRVDPSGDFPRQRIPNGDLSSDYETTLSSLFRRSSAHAQNSHEAQFSAPKTKIARRKSLGQTGRPQAVESPFCLSLIGRGTSARKKQYRGQFLPHSCIHPTRRGG